MNHERSDNQSRYPERPAFGALLALLLAPVVAQGLWATVRRWAGRCPGLRAHRAAVGDDPLDG
jgi:hypothetical protein